MISGAISLSAKGAEADVDLYRFHARKGEHLVVEVVAARDKSPLDSKLEILDAVGKPIPRVVLQAVRTSYLTFRGHNSTARDDFRLHGAADMEFNEYVYANGEVMKLWMNPRGPDSGFLVYPGYSGDRFTYFGTTGITHALNETCYIVEPHRPDEKLIPNGLPQYTLYYENDDDERRSFGNDSRIAFTAPADGDYLVRVSDVRGLGGDDFKYQLIVRPPRPDFSLCGWPRRIAMLIRGAAREFAAVVTRKDEFDGEINLEFKGLPPGFHVSSPLTIQAGQTTAYGVLSADADAPAPTPENSKKTQVIASAMVNDKLVKRKPLEFGEIKLAEQPKLLVRVLPDSRGGSMASVKQGASKGPVELFIEPGQTIAATVKLERHGFDGEVKFGTEFAGRNLPHGVYVDNIGLNGVTLLKGDTDAARSFSLPASGCRSKHVYSTFVGRRGEPDELARDAACSQRIGNVVAHDQFRRGVAGRSVVSPRFCLATFRIDGRIYSSTLGTRAEPAACHVTQRGEHAGRRALHHDSGFAGHDDGPASDDWLGRCISDRDV